MTEPDITAPVPAARSQPQRSVRAAMYLVLLALAALAIVQAVYGNRFERLRADDADLINLAGSQRTFSQQMGRVAALAADDAQQRRAHAAQLRQALDHSRADGLLLQALLARQLVHATPGARAVAQALARWQMARNTLWQRCQALLLALDESAPAAAHEQVAATALAMQVTVDPALDAASALTETLQALARERSHQQVLLLEAGVALTLALLVLLALFVVEPTARSVQRNLRRLATQADELSRLAMVAELTDNQVVITNSQRHIEWTNAAFTRQAGYQAAEARGCNPAELLHSPHNDPGTLRRVHAAITAGQAVRAELLSLAKDGHEYWLEVDIQPLVNPDGLVRGFVTVGTDITERRRLQEQMQRSARTDALTGLPNRAVVLDRVQRALEHASRHPGYGFAVLFMDFDRFKQVNDTLGHAAGDDLLRQIGRRIEDTLRPGDAVARVASELHTAARIGGDEFVVVLEGVQSSDDARTVAERLLEVLAQPYQIGSQSVQSSASIGIVTADRAAATADDVLRDADTAMYEAKRAGRGRCVLFDNAMQERVVRALETEHDLRRALREGELFVVYQPLIDLADERAIGVEALVRWRHPTRGIVPPVDFIGVAEETGLIDAVGQEVLQTACRQFALWRDELGCLAPREVAVNLSRAQLKLPGLVPEVKWVLEQNGMQPGELQFEVTESLAAQDARVQATLRELKALGVRLALDDFGTGYSSLACLHQLPVDTVKIDRSFVSHAQTVEYHRVLIEATIRVAQTLGMTTVAEGIETEAQATLMQRLRCDRGQGYLYARPLVADELSRWIVARAKSHTESGSAIDA